MISSVFSVLRAGLLPNAAVTPPVAPTPSEGPVDSELIMRAEEVTRDAWSWLQAHVLTPENLIAISVQLGVIVAALLLGRIFAPRVRRLIDQGIAKLPEQVREKAEQNITDVAMVRHDMENGIPTNDGHGNRSRQLASHG